MWRTFWSKIVFVHIYPLLLVCSKKVVKKNPNLPQDLPISNMVRKTNFLSISVLVSEMVDFMPKKKSSLWISPKMLQNNRKVLFRNMWLTLWRKTVFGTIYPLLLVWTKKSCLNNPIFRQDLPISNMVRKTNFLSISVLVSEIATFLSKKKSSLWISTKMPQNNRKAWFRSMWLNLWRKTVFVTIYPLTLVWTKKVV